MERERAKPLEGRAAVTHVAYCTSHGFHPVGIKHDSMTCIYKKPEHKSNATWCNRLGGDMYWPNAKHITVEQQEHPSWKGNEAPTN